MTRVDGPPRVTAAAANLGTIVDVTRLSPRTCLVRLALADPAFAFRAGQAVLIGLPGDSCRRAYSIACSPEQAAASGRLDLLIGLDSAAIASWPLPRCGAIVDVAGPIGTFILPATRAHRRLLFAAGGTGIAPVRSMVHHLNRQGTAEELALLYSARSAEELAFLDEWRTLAAAGRLALHATVTRADTPWDGPRGRLCGCDFESLLVDRQDTLCLVCGPPAFVRDAVTTLVDLGVLRGAIRTESWPFPPEER